MYRLALVRIEAIKKYENIIQTNAREDPTIHNFLKEFSWLLDPRIMNFEDEITYSQLLRDKFNDQQPEPEINRRVDFLCMDFANTFFIIELKRPNHIVNVKNLTQAVDYVSFIRKHGSTDSIRNFDRIEAYIVAGGVSDDTSVQTLVNSLS